MLMRVCSSLYPFKYLAGNVSAVISVVTYFLLKLNQHLISFGNPQIQLRQAAFYRLFLSEITGDC
jgi:hypothetical protein